MEYLLGFTRKRFDMRCTGEMVKRTVVALLSVAACGVSFESASAQTSFPSFLDDFRDQDIGDGMPVTWLPGGSPMGKRDASSGDLVHIPDPGFGTSTYVGDATTQEGWQYHDVLLNTRIHVEDADAGYVALFGRSSSAVGHPGVPTLYGAIKPVDSEIAIATVHGGHVHFLATEIAPLNMVGTDVNLQLLIAGDLLSLWAWDYDGPPPDAPSLIGTIPVAFPNNIGSIGVDTIEGFGGHARTTTFRHFEAKILDDALGDFNSDDLINISDLDALTSVQGEVRYSPLYDVDGDKLITSDDVPSWLALAAENDGRTTTYAIGDTNLDGTVDAADLNALALNWQQQEQRWSAGDFDASGTVDAADLNALALHWQQSIPLALATAPVPEPSSLVLSFLGLLSVAKMRRWERLTLDL